MLMIVSKGNGLIILVIQDCFWWRLSSDEVIKRTYVNELIPLYSQPQSTHKSSIECEGEYEAVSRC